MTLSTAQQKRFLAMTSYESKAKEKGYSFIAGVDEAGRGPLAGPVVAAACLLPNGTWIEEANDSKQMTPALRHRVFQEILSTPDVHFGIGVVDSLLIDQINILQASFEAMLIAIAQLPKHTDYVLVDGNQLPKTTLPGAAIVKGDNLSQSIACASIIAKVVRDQLMDFFDLCWPVYGFRRNKGYATLEHREAIRKHGTCPIHRKSFKMQEGSSEEYDGL